MPRSPRAFALVASAVFVVALAGAAAWFWLAATRDRRAPQMETSVVVPRGMTGHAAAALLAQRGVIAFPFVFEMLARLEHEQSAVKAGEYRFAPHATVAEVLQALVEGGQQVARWVTIPEGYTAKEIAQTLAARGFGDASALEATFAKDSLRFGAARTRGLEGYLFPETYLISTTASPQQIASLLTGQFRQELPPQAETLARNLGLTIPQAVTLASLVEREAKADDERALMAGVYYNRLRRGIPLEVDATIEYTFAHHKDVITYADLARDSPYNTYKRPGLPPTPIANPGRPSLLAAFYPAASDYLYYVSMGNGHHAFARTLAEHNANVARYLH